MSMQVPLAASASRRPFFSQLKHRSFSMTNSQENERREGQGQQNERREGMGQQNEQREGQSQQNEQREGQSQQNERNNNNERR
jgi:hypothetical protein